MGIISGIKASEVVKILYDRAKAIMAEKGDDGELSRAEIIEQVGKLCLDVAEYLGEDVETDGD